MILYDREYSLAPLPNRPRHNRPCFRWESQITIAFLLNFLPNTILFWSEFTTFLTGNTVTFSSGSFRRLRDSLRAGGLSFIASCIFISQENLTAGRRIEIKLLRKPFKKRHEIVVYNSYIQVYDTTSFIDVFIKHKSIFYMLEMWEFYVSQWTMLFQY